MNYSAVIPALDLADAVESFPVATALYTVNNSNGENILATTQFTTPNGPAGTMVGAVPSTTSPVTFFGLPAGRTQPGDQHRVLVAASTGTGPVTSSRLVYLHNKDLADRSVTLGPTIANPGFNSQPGSPYLRLMAAGNWTAEYGDGVGITYTQDGAATNAWSISMSRGYLGTGTAVWTLNMPDFSAVNGFNTGWGIASSLTSWSVTATGIVSGFDSATGKFSEGGSWRAASRTGTITP